MADRISHLPMFDRPPTPMRAGGTDTQPLDGQPLQAPAPTTTSPHLRDAATAWPAAPRGAVPLVVGAWPLLLMLAQLRRGAGGNAEALKLACIHAIRVFETDALRAGARADEVSAGRYVLCAAIDEQVLSTAWGDASDWASGSLLAQFHGETWGGEKVFALVERCLENPQDLPGLPDLLFYVLSLGFQGRYRLRRDGTAEVEALRDRLYASQRQRLGEPPAIEAPAPRDVAGRRLRGYAPVWTVVAVTALATVLLFLTYEALLLRRSDALLPILDRLEQAVRAP
jgi:type VI secretion system protein ImpK